MELSFLQVSGGTLGASIISVGLKHEQAYAEPLAIQHAKETTTICPYCAVG